MINNIESSVPSQVKQLFYSEIPFGASYVIYTKSTGGYNTAIYECLFTRLGKSGVSVITITRDLNGYSISRSENTGEIESVAYPYYAYSNIPQQGIRETLPVTADITATMLIVICCTILIKWVYGAIFRRS